MTYSTIRNRSADKFKKKSETNKTFLSKNQLFLAYISNCHTSYSNTQFFMNAILVSRPKHGKVFPLPCFTERHRKNSWKNIANYPYNAAHVANTKVLSIMMVEICFIANLIVSFPFFLLVACSPRIVRKEQVFVH